ncbi:MAG: hypothetical protein M1828_004832 [Chrysothrix sp. TS-e1954]|nr:MAG: hypothetical protein M1828_004832 [Chrysothrix sp. TS-e1954]
MVAQDTLTPTRNAATAATDGVLIQPYSAPRCLFAQDAAQATLQLTEIAIEAAQQQQQIQDSASEDGSQAHAPFADPKIRLDAASLALDEAEKQITDDIANPQCG